MEVNEVQRNRYAVQRFMQARHPELKVSLHESVIGNITELHKLISSIWSVCLDCEFSETISPEDAMVRITSLFPTAYPTDW